MEEIKVTWTKEEFKAYIQIYAAQSNQNETDEEKEFISHKFESLMLKSIYKEINGDNDYERIQKILANIKYHDYTQDDLNDLLSEIKNLYFSDGTLDSVEKTTFNLLVKLFNN